MLTFESKDVDVTLPLLHCVQTGTIIRNATEAEVEASEKAAEDDDGAGFIMVGNRLCAVS